MIARERESEEDCQSQKRREGASSEILLICLAEALVNISIFLNLGVLFHKNLMLGMEIW
jgi:hypothetical protein